MQSRAGSGPCVPPAPTLIPARLKSEADAGGTGGGRGKQAGCCPSGAAREGGLHRCCCRYPRALPRPCVAGPADPGIPVLRRGRACRRTPAEREADPCARAHPAQPRAPTPACTPRRRRPVHPCATSRARRCVEHPSTPPICPHQHRRTALRPDSPPSIWTEVGSIVGYSARHTGMGLPSS